MGIILVTLGDQVSRTAAHNQLFWWIKALGIDDKVSWSLGLTLAGLEDQESMSNKLVDWGISLVGMEGMKSVSLGIKSADLGDKVSGSGRKKSVGLEDKFSGSRGYSQWVWVIRPVVF